MLIIKKYKKKDIKKRDKNWDNGKRGKCNEREERET